LKVAIIGLGDISVGYDFFLNEKDFKLTHARAISNSSFFNISIGVDPNIDLRNRFEERFNCKAYSSIDEVDESIQIDLAVIATPTEKHLSIIDEIVKKWNVSAILCEKPLAYEFYEYQSIISKLKAQKINLYCNYIRRSDPGVISIKNHIVSQDWEERFTGNFVYNKGFIHNGSHLVSMLIFFFGPMIDVGDIELISMFGEKDYNLSGKLKFKNCTITFFPVFENSFTEFRLDIYSEKGKVEYKSGGSEILWHPVVEHENLDNYRVLSRTPDVIFNDMNNYQMNVYNQLELSLTGKAAEICTHSEILELASAYEKILKGIK
tara:strand:+ start:211 stop:1173 length:963 start_codon:yes stop_codon:yes gene_type:complete